jgi:hypothetical protein
MEAIKCLLLLAAVLSFAAVNAAYDAQEGDDVESCESFKGAEFKACDACCKLLGKDGDWQTMWEGNEEVFEEDPEHPCVCVENESLDPPTEDELKEYEELVHGDVDDSQAEVGDDPQAPQAPPAQV